MPYHDRSRREALKTLAALTGAAALTNLPNRWEPPVIESGILPAHAQISDGPTVSNLRVVVYGQGTLGCEGNSPYPVDFVFNYADPQGGIVPGARFDVYEGGTLAFSDNLVAGDFVSGDGFSGSVLIAYCLNYQPQTNSGLELFSTVSGRGSGVVTTTQISNTGLADSGQSGSSRRTAPR